MGEFLVAYQHHSGFSLCCVTRCVVAAVCSSRLVFADPSGCDSGLARSANALIEPEDQAILLAPFVLWTIRNVWSAAVLQAKNEDDRIGLRECIRPLLE
ncbi:MAG TPA: hypothetical protein VMR02_09485 [Terracidiphilus sp.]|jgi:hypothetical protein|nr:hypothetical protein [Terracidiphilus sp.]